MLPRTKPADPSTITTGLVVPTELGTTIRALLLKLKLPVTQTLPCILIVQLLPNEGLPIILVFAGHVTEPLLLHPAAAAVMMFVAAVFWAALSYAGSATGGKLDHAISPGLLILVPVVWFVA